jgi:tRNA threonylcarbamoyl adenosine modification protein (Sua5/YciO/YrdC/YwlC family)
VDYGAKEGLMAERISMLDPNFDLTAEVEKGASALRDGKIIIAPLEHGYVFLADAFNHGAVKKIHRLRQDPVGVATQVLIGDLRTATGIVSELNATVTAICEKFWPGLLTLNIAPAQGLVWDLGDARSLGQISIRVPAAELARNIALISGPLAVASASLVGMPPKRSTTLFPALDGDYAYLFDGGELPEGPASTVLSVTETGVMMTRAGAITLAQLREVTPNIGIPA